MSETHQNQSFDEDRAGLPDISPDVSVIWKPLHRLFQDGNPVNPVTVLYYEMDDGRQLPFATIAKTPGNRLLLWPPSDAREAGEFTDGDTFAIHHITLELSNGQTHFTRFDATSERVHEDRGWKLSASDSGLSMWVIGAFRIDLLEKQVGALEQNIGMPSTDSNRRIEEFKRYGSEMKHAIVKTPPLRGDCFVTVFHLMTDSSFRGPIEPAHFPTGGFWSEWIDAWPDGDNFQIVPTGISVSGINLVLLTAAPPGRLRGACFFGSVSHQQSS